MAKKTIKKAEKILTASKQKTVTKVSKGAKVAPKKVAPKKEVIKKVEIKAKKLAGNLIVWIGTTKLVSPNISDKDLKSMTNKIALYNKIPTEARKSEILKFFESAKKKETDLKATKAKGIKKVLKSVKKAVPKKDKVVEEKDEEIKIQEKTEKFALTLNEMIKIEQESVRTLGRGDRGYKHPVTGRTWNGERYQ